MREMRGDKGDNRDITNDFANQIDIKP